MLGAGARISWEVPHAHLRAKQRKVAVFIAERIICQAAVCASSTEVSGAERVIVSGRDDGRPINVVLELEAEVIKVISVIRTD